MATAADEYYTMYTRGVAHADVAEWERQMKEAEDKRMQNRTVMDIIGAQEPHPERGTQNVDSDLCRGPVFEWIQLAIIIEEKQWVTIIRNFSS
jgi:hypothetical protein